MRTPLLVFLATFILYAQQKVQFRLIPKEDIEKGIEAAPKENAARADALRTRFEEAGCAVTGLPVRRSKLPNLECVLPGEAQARIVVGAHYDKVSAGDGVIDNWTGTMLLPALYISMRVAPRRHTFVFVGFSDEERGLVGSSDYVRGRSGDEIRNIRAMVNLDSLGLTPTKIGVSTSDKALVTLAVTVAQSVQLKLGYVDFGKVGLSDSAPFRSRKIPVIDFHSVTQETLPVLHTKEDRREALNVDDYMLPIVC
jgi:hypothetical protein